MHEPSTPLGRRVLAAIMFTDAVEFSIAVRVNEELALSRIQRDLELIRAVCSEHEGQTLKNTGDGLLVLFASAVQAVGAALKIQQSFRERDAADPGAKGLLHRIGIHLGDVLVTERDVLGEGVNFAAQLQAEAEPGGICISQTTYEVVKNRLPLEAVTVGELQLKDVHETLALYHLRPAGAPPLRVRPARKTVPRGWLIGAGVAALVVAGVFWGEAALRFLEGDKPSPGGEIVAASAPAPSTRPQGPPPAAPTQSGNAPWDAVRAKYRQQNDFVGLARWLESKEAAQVLRDGNERKSLAARYRRLDSLTRAFQAELAQHTQAKPLEVEALTAQGPATVRIWTDAKRRVHISDGKTTDELPLDQMVGIRVAQVLMGRMHQDRMSGRAVPREREDDISFLAREFGMPAPPAPGEAPGGPGIGGGEPGGGPPDGFGGGPPGAGAPGPPGGGRPGGPPPNGSGAPGQPGGFGADGRPIPYGRPGELNGVTGGR